MEDQVQEAATELDIDEHLECFRARRVGGSSEEELVSRCWDLPALNDRYQDFIQRWEPRKEGEGSNGKGRSDQDCYTLRFDLIHEFRAFPLEDPYLPRRLLPSDWKGDCAAGLFRQLHEQLAGPADRYVDGVLGQGPGVPEPAMPP